MGLFRKITIHVATIIGASLSEPHTNQFYEKTAVLMYVCMYVAICQTCAR